jgi:branched-chain amino acid transport system substrate-binding protein
MVISTTVPHPPEEERQAMASPETTAAVRRRSNRAGSRWRRATLVLVAVAALPLAACSSGGGSAPDGATWKVGAIVDETGPGAAAYAGTADVLQAWASTVNDAGGINGHKIDLIVKDSLSTPAGGLQAANELVRENVVALVQGGSLVAASFAKPLTDAGIPVICGAPAASAPWGVETNFYPCVPSNTTSTDLIAKAAVASGYKTVGVVTCVEAPACGITADAMVKSGQKFGLSVPVQTTALSAPSFAAPCLALKQAHADLVFAIAPPDTTFSIIDACGQQDFKPAYVGGQLSDQFLTNPNVGGFVGLTETAPYFADLPALQAFRDAMAKYAPQAFQEHPDTSATIWAGGKIFEQAAAVGKFGDSVTAADVTAALNTFQNETIGGLTAPLTFTNGNRLITCGFVVSIENGQFADPFGTKPVCPADS